MAGEGQADRPTGGESNWTGRSAVSSEARRPEARRLTWHQKQKPGDKSQQPEGDACPPGSRATRPPRRPRSRAADRPRGGEQRQQTPQASRAGCATKSTEIRRRGVNLSLGQRNGWPRTNPIPLWISSAEPRRVERFYRQWSGVRRAGQNQAAKRTVGQGLESLGLRSMTRNWRPEKGHRSTRDLKQSRRIAPPPGWAEQFRLFESVAGGGKDE